MKKNSVVRTYYILPCCLLLLNLCNNLVSYKAGVIANPMLRTVVIVALVLFGSSLVAFAAAPTLAALVRGLHRGSQKGAGLLGEIVFLILLGVGVFWLYYQLYVHGPEAILPEVWWNPKH